MSKRLSFDECWETLGRLHLLPELFEIEPIDRPQQVYSELKLFYQLVQQFKPRCVLEIGSYVGGSLRFWINAAHENAKIIVVERHPNVSALLRIWDSWLNDNQQLFLINKDSMRQKDEVVKEIEQITKDVDVDFLFIDGEHKSPFFQSDFVTYAPLVRAGGIVALHDIAPAPLNAISVSGLANFWQRIKLGLVDMTYIETVEIICRHRTTGVSGIGVILVDTEKREERLDDGKMRSLNLDAGNLP